MRKLNGIYIPFSGVASPILMLTSAVSRVTSNSSIDDILAALESNSSGKLSHGPPNSLRSLASDALEDLREDARLPRCTCRNADRRLCQPPPGDDVCVISSTSSASRSFSFFRLCNVNKNSEHEYSNKSTIKKVSEFEICAMLLI